MPTSPWTNIAPILEIILDLQPRPSRVLDIGIGYGKFGFLCREYLAYWNSPEEPRPILVDGVEAFPQYVGPLQREIYNQIFTGDAREILPRLAENSYDLVLLIDVLEHFERNVAAKIARECQRVGRVAIISTPTQFWPQEDSWDNPYERHKSLWSKKDLLRLGAVRVRRAENWIAVFAKPPYRDTFTWHYRLWRLGNSYIPAGLRPVARRIYRNFSPGSR